MKTQDQHLSALFLAISKLDTPEECRRFFTDLCTPAELESFSDRWRVAQLLAQGLHYREIYERTGVSTATVTRVARSLTYGEEGYQVVLKKMGRFQKKEAEKK